MRSFTCAALVLAGCRTVLPCCTPANRGDGKAAVSGARGGDGVGEARLASAQAPDAGQGEGDASVDAPHWEELVRAEQWDRASQALEALPEAQKNSPRMRLLRARVAMLRDDCATAVHLLAKLEEDHDLSVLSEDIRRWRAEAQLVSGPFEEAASYFERLGGGRALAKAALALDRAGRTEDAKLMADRSLSAGGLGDAELAVRSLRSRLAEGRGQNGVAADDARWVCVHRPGSPEAESAEELLVRMDPTHPLSGKERVARAGKLSQAGRTEDALAELNRAQNGPSPAGSDEVAWSRAFSLYRSRANYDKAATAFDALASQKGPRQAEALFYAARSRSRADHDDDALKGYGVVRRRFPSSSFADEAAYLSARLQLMHGRWEEAATRYAQYLKDYPRGQKRRNAAYEQALVLLAGTQPTKARAALRRMALAASSPMEAARLRELEGVAAQRAGERESAIKLWMQVLQADPLGWAALAARARLTRVGQKLPPLLDPADAQPPERLAIALPTAVGLYHQLGLDTDAEAYLHAHEHEAAQSFGQKETQALCWMYGEIGRASRRYRVGLDKIPQSALSRAISPATEWAWDCLYPRPFLDTVQKLEEREHLPRGLVYAVMRQESGYNPAALSPANAVGLLQLMPDTARRLAEDSGTPFEEKTLRSPAVNLELGARYLARMLRAFDGSIPLAVAAYNAGPGAVAKWAERMRGVDLDLWAALIPFEETRTYVIRVLSNLSRYAYREGGESLVPVLDLQLPNGAKLETSSY